jgi:hypothetical protein
MPRFSGTRRSPSISRFGSVIEGGNLEMVYPGSTASGDLGLLLLSAVDMEGVLVATAERPLSVS